MRTLVAAITVGAQRTLRQRNALLTTGVFYLLVTTVLGAVWRAAAEFNDGAVAGYSAVALVWYIAATEASVVSLPSALIDTVGRSITSGEFEVELLRPTSPLLVRVGLELGSALPRLVVCVVSGTALAWLVGGPPPSLAALCLAAPVLVLAITLNLVFQHAFAGGSFWIRDTHAAWFLYQKMVFLVGGMLLPLQVLPRPMEIVAQFLPFASMAYAPGRFASGHIELQLIVMQVIWLVVGVLVARRVFAAGTERLMEVAA